MASNMALNLIAEVMDWEEGETSPATKEYAWLKMMSSIKYDGYADFRAGVRFIESLAVWLKQFDKDDREAAYQFFKTRLVYISPAELQCLIEIFVPEVVTPNLRRRVAAEMQIKPYEVWSTAKGADLFKSRMRRTLFMGMSDGSRIDIFRRANAGRINTEQVVATYALDDKKWLGLGKDLIKAEGAEAKFENVYLIDDFTASGTTFIRYTEGEWKGKLAKFNQMVIDAKSNLKDDFPLQDKYSLHIHHYISSDQARMNLDALVAEAVEKWDNRTFETVEITEGLRLPASLKLSPAKDAEVISLCDKYYDPDLDVRLAEHLAESKITTAKYGYAGCALPLIMDHNTPNNSIPLLWAETDGVSGGHPMSPLFRRRDRHG